jgi:hypothetical protein
MRLTLRRAKKDVIKGRQSLKKSIKKSGPKSKRTLSLKKSLRIKERSLKLAKDRIKHFLAKCKKGSRKASRKGSMSRHVDLPTLEDRCYVVAGSDFKPLQIKGKKGKDKLIKSLKAKGKKGIISNLIRCCDGIKRTPTKFGSGRGC